MANKKPAKGLVEHLPKIMNILQSMAQLRICAKGRAKKSMSAAD